MLKFVLTWCLKYLKWSSSMYRAENRLKRIVCVCTYFLISQKGTSPRWSSLYFTHRLLKLYDSLNVPTFVRNFFFKRNFICKSWAANYVSEHAEIRLGVACSKWTLMTWSESSNVRYLINGEQLQKIPHDEYVWH
jgi:hypothetical protein